MSHGLPIAESRDKVKISVKEIRFGGKYIVLTELLIGIRETYCIPICLQL